MGRTFTHRRVALVLAGGALLVVAALALAGPFRREPPPNVRIRTECNIPNSPAFPLEGDAACPTSASLSFVSEAEDARVPATAYVLVTQRGTKSLGQFPRGYAGTVRVPLQGLEPGPAAVVFLSSARDVQTAEIVAAVRGRGDLEGSLAALGGFAGRLREQGPATVQIRRFDIR